jgi:hypothetical protein
MMAVLTGRGALVTGASTGIGAAAHRFRRAASDLRGAISTIGKRLADAGAAAGTTGDAL